MESLHDWDLYLKIAMKYDFDFAPEALVKYYRNNSGLTRNVQRRLQAQEITFDRYLKYMKSRRIVSFHCSRRGIMLNLCGRSAEGRRWLVQSLRMDWRNPRALAFLCLSLLGSRAFAGVYYALEGTALEKTLNRGSDQKGQEPAAPQGLLVPIQG